MINNQLQDNLRSIVGTNKVLSDTIDLDRYSTDALTPSRAFGIEDQLNQLADVVVIPSNVSQISRIMTLANETKTPVIPYGGGTGVMGGVLPIHGGIIINTRDLNSVLEINPVDRTTRVESGVRIGSLGETLERHGLMPAHDPYSQSIATIGGAISTNGVGYKAGSYGTMGDQVVSMEVVLPNGTVIDTKSVPTYSSGPNLNHIFIGTEGVFGIITKVTLKIFRIPESQIFSTWSFDTFDQGFNACVELHALGIRPTLLDLTEEPPNTLLYLLYEGYAEGVEAQKLRAHKVLTSFGGIDIGPHLTDEYWSHRHDSAVTYKLEALDQPRAIRWNRFANRSFDYLHVSLPISKILEYRRRCDSIFALSDFQVVEYAIWSRPEMFSMMITPKADIDMPSQESLGRLVDEILILAQDMGGIMEYCHGIGVKLNHLIQREMGTSYQTIQLLKQSLDPAGIMNPGKLSL
ncbi:MAG: FAD-binding oxidoreductase [Chloroflexota bacterium]|nr:FAD-binding oxidoreductase [Chloroflexota bacterium]